MKKILITVMSCNDDFFIKQEQIMKETWIKQLNQFDNIDYIIYRGDPNIEKHKYDKQNHLLSLRCEDDLNNTFKKTYYAFKLAHKICDYDYIFRTNTSTYVNVVLLNQFIQKLEDDNILWASDLYSLSNSFCPYPLYLYGRGNGMILSKKLVDIILSEGISYLYLEKCDDWLIGNILNTYWIKQGKNYLDYIKGYKHGWYKCVPDEQPNNHKLCVYGNKNKDWEFIKQFITIQIKRYRERHLENAQYKELNVVFEQNKYNNDELEEVVKSNIEYSKRPSVFIGSILGYTDYEDWKSCNKMELFNYQVKHKATDDEEFGKDTKWL